MARTAKPAPYWQTVLNNDGEKVRQQRTDPTGKKLGWRLRVHDPRSGRQPEQVFYGTYEEAVVELGRLSSELEESAAPTFAHAKAVTVGDWVLAWLPTYAWKIPPSRNGAFAGVQRPYSTYKKAKYMIEGQLLDALGEKTKMRAITHDDLVDAIAGLTRKANPDVPLAPRSKSTAADVVRSMFRDAKKAGVLTRNPAEKLPGSWAETNVTRRTALIPSLADVEALAAAMDAAWPLPPWASDLYGPNGEGRGDLVRLLAYTGMRWEELAALPAELVTPSKRTIWVRDTATESGGRRQHRHEQGKTKAAVRHLILVDQALPVVRRLNAIRKRGAELEPARQARREARASRTGKPVKRVPTVTRWTLLVCGEEGGFQSYGHWRKNLYPAQGESGVDYDAHDLRHVCASLLYAAGEGAGVITEQMGHEDERTTRRIYRHLFAVDHTEVARRVSAKIAAITEAERLAAEDAEAGESTAVDGSLVVEPDDDWL